MNNSSKQISNVSKAKIINKKSKESKEFKKKWSDLHEKKYDWLYNYVVTLHPEAKKEDYIDVYKPSLATIIKENPKWGPSSQEGLLFMVARWLEIHKKRYVKDFKRQGHELTEQIHEKEGQNKLDEKEQLNFRPHSYFVELLNNIDKSTIVSLQDHYKYLLLNLLTYQPPLRTSFYNTARFIRFKKDNDKINNFVLINRQGKLKCYFIVNKDKASNYRQYAINKDLSVISIENDNLSKLIDESYIKYPRNYLFEINEKPVSTNTLLTWLRNITKVSDINFDIMRSSFITWKYEKNTKSADREKLAKQMRHSVPTALKNYNKVLNTEEENDPSTLIELQNKMNQMQYEKNILQEKLNTYVNKDDSNVNDKLYRKRRTDIIYKLNHNKPVKDESKVKYKISYDTTTNKFY